MLVCVCVCVCGGGGGVPVPRSLEINRHFLLFRKIIFFLFSMFPVP